MVFKPTVVKPTMGKWSLDPDLPEHKYKTKDGRFNLTALAKDVTDKLPVRRFSDRVAFMEVAKKAFRATWPDWDKYFSPLVRDQFERSVMRAVAKYAEITLSSEQDDNRSDSNSTGKTPTDSQ